MIEDKEETLTSVLPTVTAINSILERFGFTGFKLAENMNKKGTYKILRQMEAMQKDIERENIIL